MMMMMMVVVMTMMMSVMIMITMVVVMKMVVKICYDHLFHHPKSPSIHQSINKFFIKNESPAIPRY